MLPGLEQAELEPEQEPCRHSQFPNWVRVREAVSFCILDGRIGTPRKRNSSWGGGIGSSEDPDLASCDYDTPGARQKGGGEGGL